MSAIKNVLDQLLAGLCIALFTALVLVVTWQVFTRQVIGDPSTWTSTTAQYLFVWLSLFGAAYVFSERGHIAVDFLARKTGGRAQKAVGAFTMLVVLAFALIVLIWGGLRGVGLTWAQNVSGLPVNVGQMYLALPVSGALITFYALHHLRKIAVGREAGLPINEDEEIGRHTSSMPLIASQDPRITETRLDPRLDPRLDGSSDPDDDTQKGR
ncbi:TRAP transporter small permease subunit [Kocuria kalidii]|uniref:TRAP transporter small permease n=1 Tax=Kocuria kalidii TaxID=3376283 RepID=UPI0037A78D21